MFAKLKTKIAGSALASLLKSLASDPKTNTTIVGILAGAVLAVPGLDLSALISGDPAQIARVSSGILVAGIGALAGRAGHDGHTTLLGVLAGSLQASSGQLAGITTGVVLALCGYLTNKPVASGAKQ